MFLLRKRLQGYYISSPFSGSVASNLAEATSGNNILWGIEQ